MNLVSVGFISLLAASSNELAQGASPLVVPVSSRVSPQLGQGFRADTGAHLQRRCTVATPAQPVNGGVVDTQITIKYLESAAALARELGVSASLRWRGGLLAGDARYKYAEKALEERSSSYGLVRLRMVIQEPQEAHKRANDLPSGPKFKEECGTHYVQHLVRGAEYVAVYEANASSSESKAELAAEFNGRSNMTLKATAEVSAKFEERVRSNMWSITIFRRGGSEALKFTDWPSLVQNAQALQTDAQAKPATLEVLLAPYSTVGLTESPSACASWTAEDDAAYLDARSRAAQAQHLAEALKQMTEVPAAEAQARISYAEQLRKLVQNYERCCDKGPAACSPSDERASWPVAPPLPRVCQMPRTQYLGEIATQRPGIEASVALFDDGVTLKGLCPHRQYRVQFSPDATTNVVSYIGCTGNSCVSNGVCSSSGFWYSLALDASAKPTQSTMPRIHVAGGPGTSAHVPALTEVVMEADKNGTIPLFMHMRIEANGQCSHVATLGNPTLRAIPLENP